MAHRLSELPPRMGRGLRSQLSRDRRHRSLPTRLRTPGPAHRRRLSGIGQPRCQPITHHHRPSRTRNGVLAQQERRRHLPPHSAPHTPGSHRSRRCTRQFPQTQRKRCACHSPRYRHHLPAHLGHQAAAHPRSRTQLSVEITNIEEAKHNPPGTLDQSLPQLRAEASAFRTTTRTIGR